MEMHERGLRDGTTHLTGRLLCLVLSATAPGIAAAQSDVTIFGIVDASVRYVKNGSDTARTLASGGLNSSRLGFRGREDLGDGLSAEFWLESGLNTDTGTQADAGRFWGRRATVALKNRLGELRLGRDYSPTYLGFDQFDVFNGSGVGAVDRFMNRLGTDVDNITRTDNLVSYFLPAELGGVYGQLSAAPSEGVNGKKLTGGRLGYASGPANVSVAYSTTKVTPIGGENTFKIAEIGGSYKFARATLMGFFTQNKFSAQKIGVAQLGVHIPVGPGTIRVSYTRANASGRTATGTSIDANDAKQLALGYVHDLSKRTALYATYARIDNDGAASYAVSTPPAIAAGATSTGAEVGIRHRF